MLSVIIIKRSILFLILGLGGLFISISAVGKNYYLPGYVVLANGDTLQGLVMDRKETFTGTEILGKVRFKLEGKGRRKKYDAYQLKAYQIDGVEYESFSIRPLGISLLTPYYEIVPNAGERTFLRVVSRGVLSHYQLEWADEDSSIETVDLFRREDAPLFIRATQGLFGLKRKRLIEYFTDCPDLQQKLQQKDFKYAHEVAEYYNWHCPPYYYLR